MHLTLNANDLRKENTDKHINTHFVISGAICLSYTFSFSPLSERCNLFPLPPSQRTRILIFFEQVWSRRLWRNKEID